MANEPVSPSQTDAWKSALASRRTQVADTEALPAALVSPLDRDVSRRNFIRASFWGGLGVTLLGSVGLLLDFLYPRNVRGFGGPVPAGNVADYVKGADPVPNSEGQFWMANLDPAESRLGGTGGADGLLALWRKCPHLGCTVPWRSTFSYEGDSEGWYRCPCHGSTYTKSGVRVFGPAPRSMDTMAIEIDSAGNITVQTGAITPGGPDNPERAVPV
ncbi:MAG: ubiquinol-cytochrome c reductase iron-sulfur subunit [Dehalococcoidia bacterium]|nr:ubiquinol-cytochrome c reductase iron-sulfur subunit [Dehalococcoidia bacterium]